MFKTVYRCARTAARHESGPAAKSRLAYLEHLAAGVEIDFVPEDHFIRLERILFAPELPLAYCLPQAILNGPAAEVLSLG